MGDNRGTVISQWAELILDSVFDVIAVADQGMTILDVNEAIRSIGYEKNDVVGKSILDFTVNVEELRSAFQVVADDNGIDRQDLRIQVKKKDGGLYFADLSIRKIHSTDVVDYLLTYHDVDDRAKARRELEEQKARIEQALRETEMLRREAEESRAKLLVANQALAERQAITERQLEDEKSFRLLQGKTNFQKSFAQLLVGLVLVALMLPYLSGVITVETKVLDSTGNLSLLLLQTLGIVAGALFQQQRNKKDGEDQ